MQIETPPEALAGFFTSVDEIARGLRDEPVSVDELNRARLPSVEAIQRAKATNGYWLGALEDVQYDPQLLDSIRSVVPDLQAITPAELQQAAKTWLTPNRVWRAQVTAQPAAVPAS